MVQPTAGCRYLAAVEKISTILIFRGKPGNPYLSKIRISCPETGLSLDPLTTTPTASPTTPSLNP